MGPSDLYSERLEARERSRTRWDQWHARLGGARLGLAAGFLILAFAWRTRGTAGWWLLVPSALFVAVVLYHQRVQRLRALAGRAVDFYRSGLDRLQGKAISGGPSGDRFNDGHHVYCADLDLFGKHGLFERLSTARTPMGESTLAGWLLAPAVLDDIRKRHECIAELRNRMDLREDLAILGEPRGGLPRGGLPRGGQPRGGPPQAGHARDIAPRTETITNWANAPSGLPRRWLWPTAFLLAAAALVTAALWATMGIAFPFLLVLVIEAAVSHAFRKRVRAAVAGVEDAYEEVKLLSVLLLRVETESFDSPHLRALRDQLTSRSLPASATLSKLATIVGFVEARRNPLLAPLLLPSMYVIQSALAAERWRELHGPVVASWLGVLGEIEALESITSYSFERPDDPFPEFVTGSAAFVATGLGHPLIAPGTRVRNDVDLSGPTKVLMVSGSNMSGKSTLLRSVGMNTVLAMAGAPVCAARLRLTPLRVGASIRVNDSLFEGSSRFYAEITRLRQLFEPTSLPLLFLLDELLQGTNSHDRRIGAQGVLRELVHRGAIGLVSTHDLALADGAELPAGALKNVHFQDELENGRLSFDFKLRDGVVTKSNGLALMRAIGLDV
jgi:hypothetical protein